MRFLLKRSKEITKNLYILFKNWCNDCNLQELWHSHQSPESLKIKPQKAVDFLCP